MFFFFTSSKPDIFPYYNTLIFLPSHLFFLSISTFPVFSFHLLLLIFPHFSSTLHFPSPFSVSLLCSFLEFFPRLFFCVCVGATTPHRSHHLYNSAVPSPPINLPYTSYRSTNQDEAYNRVHAGCLSASTRLGDSTLAVVCLLHRGAASAPADEFRAVVMHLRMLAERDLDSIDFFWPQVFGQERGGKKNLRFLRGEG